ncbi:MAG: hypothetical protein OEW04_02780, partial [Nitrospirota bacterium]|nr:hypothetical protein [Nitrospirota bacterium]
NRIVCISPLVASLLTRVVSSLYKMNGDIISLSGLFLQLQRHASPAHEQTIAETKRRLLCVGVEAVVSCLDYFS